MSGPDKSMDTVSLHDQPSFYEIRDPLDKEESMMRHGPILLLKMVILLLFTSCATVPLASPDLYAAAKEFKPHPDKALIYIVRPGAFVGAAINITPVFDQKILGALKGGTYAVVEAAPGPHQVALFGGENVGVVNIDAEAGRLYFVRVQPGIGIWASQVLVELLTEERGKEFVKVGQRAQMLEALSTPKR
jgi:hypothetical protein